MNNKINLYPSLMCANSNQFGDYIKLFEKTNMKAIHFDVMDGQFVPNTALDTNEFNIIRDLSALPIDVHLMVTNPEEYMKHFNFKPGDSISFHPETTKNIKGLLDTIRNNKCKAGIAISPNTTIDYVKEYINDIDFVLVMAVNPGFAGQKMLPGTIEKIRDIKNILNDDIELIVDGNTNSENTIKMHNAGANGFVAGTSSLFKGNCEDFINNLNIYLKETNLII